MPALDTAKDVLAVVGGACVVLAPLLRAYVRAAVAASLADAPTMIKLTNRVESVEKWQDDHEDDVKLIPRLADTLDRLERTLEGLSRVLMHAGAQHAPPSALPPVPRV